MSLVQRLIKGSPLTGQEYDDNNLYLESLSQFEDITYADLTTLKNGGNLVPNTIYHITDRDYWLRSINDSKLSNDGIRLMRCPMETYYTPQTITGTPDIEYLGIYGQTINQGSVPVSDGTIVYRAIWGGKLWERDTSGADGGTTVQDIIDGGGWTQIATTETEYEDCIFSITYDFDNDIIGEQRDWKGNIIKNLVNPTSTTTGTNTVDITDWNLSSITKNYNNGIYNNIIIIIISEINPFYIIINSIQNNSNAGNINSNSNTGDINNNSNNGNINSNSNNGDINNNSNNGEIENNSNVGYIDTNSNGGSISNNSNNNDIRDNSNNGAIDNNSNTGAIQTNSNNGYISSASSSVGTILFNTNNGYIDATNLSGTIIGTVVNKQ